MYSVVLVCLIGAAACTPIGDVTGVRSETIMCEREAHRRMVVLSRVQFHTVTVHSCASLNALYGCALGSILHTRAGRKGWETALIDCGASCMYLNEFGALTEILRTEVEEGAKVFDLDILYIDKAADLLDLCDPTD